MKWEYWMVGKTQKAFIQEGIRFYLKRIQAYCSFQIQEIPTQKFRTRQEEMNHLIERFHKNDYIVLLDEKGKNYRSLAFARHIEQLNQLPYSRVLFISGSAEGFSPELIQNAHELLSLSPMTFPHELIRLIFLEQFYRAFTIIHGHPYHNE